MAIMLSPLTTARWCLTWGKVAFGKTVGFQSKFVLEGALHLEKAEQVDQRLANGRITFLAITIPIV